MGESRIVYECLEWLAIHRIRAHRNNTGAGWLVPQKNGKKPRTTDDARWIEFGQPGSGDIIGLIRPSGIHLEVECKTTTGRKRKLQELRHELINGDGGIHVFVRSADELERHLREHPSLAALTLDF